MIVRQGARYVVKSHDGTKELGTYNTEEEAKKRLAEVEYFKQRAKGPKPGGPLGGL